MVQQIVNPATGPDKLGPIRSKEQLSNPLYAPLTMKTNVNLQKILLENETIEAGVQKRLIPQLNVDHYRYLHLHLASGSQKIKELGVKVLFGTSVPSKILLCDSAVCLKGEPQERPLHYATPSDFEGSGLIMSIPVIAPLLYDIVLTNQGGDDIHDLFVTIMASGS